MSIRTPTICRGQEWPWRVEDSVGNSSRLRMVLAPGVSQSRFSTSVRRRSTWWETVLDRFMIRATSPMRASESTPISASKVAPALCRRGRQNESCCGWRYRRDLGLPDVTTVTKRTPAQRKRERRRRGEAAILRMALQQIPGIAKFAGASS